MTYTRSKVSMNNIPWPSKASWCTCTCTCIWPVLGRNVFNHAPLVGPYTYPPGYHCVNSKKSCAWPKHSPWVRKLLLHRYGVLCPLVARQVRARKCTCILNRSDSERKIGCTVFMRYSLYYYAIAHAKLDVCNTSYHFDELLWMNVMKNFFSS